MPASPGTYRWVAAYAGDGRNHPAAGAYNAPGEPVTVKARPSLTTATSPTAAAIGQPVTATDDAVPAPPAGGVLPRTGAAVLRLAALGLLLLAGGGLALSRRWDRREPGTAR